MGRTASHFYVKYDTVEIFNELMKPVMNEAEILAMISHSQEFEQLKVDSKILYILLMHALRKVWYSGTLVLEPSSFIDV